MQLAGQHFFLAFGFKLYIVIVKKLTYIHRSLVKTKEKLGAQCVHNVFYIRLSEMNTDYIYKVKNILYLV